MSLLTIVTLIKSIRWGFKPLIKKSKKKMHIRPDHPWLETSWSYVRHHPKNLLVPEIKTTALMLSAISILLILSLLKKKVLPQHQLKERPIRVQRPVKVLSVQVLLIGRIRNQMFIKDQPRLNDKKILLPLENLRRWNQLFLSLNRQNSKRKTKNQVFSTMHIEWNWV